MTEQMERIETVRIAGRAAEIQMTSGRVLKTTRKFWTDMFFLDAQETRLAVIAALNTKEEGA